MFFNALNYLHFLKVLLKFKNVANHDKFYTAMNILALAALALSETPRKKYLHMLRHEYCGIRCTVVYAHFS